MYQTGWSGSYFNSVEYALSSIFDFSELANKQTNELQIKKIYTHIAEMNIFIDNTL
jgi:hypothetical protein